MPKPDLTLDPGLNTFAAKPKLYEVISIAIYILSVEGRERKREKEEIFCNQNHLKGDSTLLPELS